jgi:Tfp pilus assembly protein PilN
MSTTLIPLDPATNPMQSARMLSIAANLLPEEVIAGRRAKQSRTYVIIALVLVAALCAGWFAYEAHEKRVAEDELNAANDTVTSLQRDQKGFAETLQVKADTTVRTEQLNTVMANDLDWAAMLDTLRASGTPSKVTVDGVNGTMDSPDNTTSTTAVLPGSATGTTVGELVINGWAPDKKAVAAYADALAKQTVLTNPYVTTVAKNEERGGVTFSLKAEITSASLCGRFTTACKSTGGK